MTVYEGKMEPSDHDSTFSVSVNRIHTVVVYDVSLSHYGFNRNITYKGFFSQFSSPYLQSDK